MFNWEKSLSSLSSLFFYTDDFRFFVLLFCFLKEKFCGTLRILLSNRVIFQNFCVFVCLNSESICIWLLKRFLVYTRKPLFTFLCN